MNKYEIETYMDDILQAGLVMQNLGGDERRRAFDALKESAQGIAKDTYFNHGLKRTFGLSNQHRVLISQSMKLRWQQRKEASK